MVKRLLVCLLAVLFAVSVGGMALAADKAKGTISDVAAGGKSITVKTEDGKDVKVKVSKTTTMKGIGSRDELKAGQNVSVTYEGDTASQVSVK
jgi:Ni/Co efflux regulator RcnB